MAELLKNIYNDQFFNRFVLAIKDIIPEFDDTAFLKQMFDDEWDNKELKQRIRHIALVFKAHLTGDFSTHVATLLKLIPALKNYGFKDDNFEFTFLPDFIEIYGLDHYETSIKAMEDITKFVSCEFAIRPFIIKYQDAVMKQMLLWADHEHKAVRRLSSEGCRPRLPWAMALPALKKDPKPVISILKKLKNDPSEYVRRSVANNLNDISKDNPDLVISLLKTWYGKTKETDWLVKHAARTLLKQGNTELMVLFGFGAINKIKISDFEVLTPRVYIGESLEFSLTLTNLDTKDSKIRLEYGLYYLKANGTLSRKVFKISEKTYASMSTTKIRRKQSFKVITTRKFHPGKHQVSIIINGQELNDILDFELV